MSSFDKELEEALKKLKKKENQIDNSLTSGKLSYLPGSDDIAPFVSPIHMRTPSPTDPSEIEEEEDGGLDFFDSGAFSDGYQFGDITKTILGTAGDVVFNVGTGAMNLLEGAADGILYGAGLVTDIVGLDDASTWLRDQAKVNVVDNVMGGLLDYVDDYSVSGDTTDSAMQGLGYSAGIMTVGSAGALAGLGKVGTTLLTTGTTFTSGFGSGTSEAYNSGEDVSDLEAYTYGVMKGAVEAGTEALFGGIGKGVNALGISHGVGGIDDMLATTLTKKLTNQTKKSLIQYGIKSVGEGVEEVLAGLGTATAKWLTYKSEEEWGKLVEDEKLLESFVTGALSSAMSQSGFVPGMQQGGLKQSIKSGRDFISGYTQNEQKVIDKEVENRIAKEEESGKKLTNKDKKAIEEKVKSDLGRGYISIDTIEDVLGDKSEYDSVKSEYDEYTRLYETESGKLSKKDQDRLAELEAKNKATPYDTLLKNAKDKMSQGVFDLSKDGYLAESYRERARLNEDFQYDLSKYSKSKYQDAVKQTFENAVKAGANNTNAVHDLVDMNARLAGDTGIVFEYQTGEQIKNAFVERQTAKIQEIESIPEAQLTQEQSKLLADLKDTLAKVESGEITVNGDITADRIVLNLDSPNPLNRTVGHEITHSFEPSKGETSKQYTALRDALFAYAKEKGVDIDGKIAELKIKYQGITNANPEAELVADLVGDYLFTDNDFINNLSTKHRNVAQKIYDEIKHLLKMATAGSKEARELEKVKKAFEDAFRKSATKNTADGGVRYSITEPFTDSNGTNFDNAVLLDTDFFDGISPRNWGEKLRTMVYERASSDPFILPIVDESGNTTLLQFAKPNERVSKDGKSNHKVLDELHSSSDNISKLAVIHIDEIVSVSEENAPYYTNENNHQWLDENGWLHRNANVINKTNGNIYNLTIDIAKAADGRTILYATDGKIKRVGNVNVNSLKIKGSRQNSNSGDMVARKGETVKRNYSLSDSDGNQLSEAQQEFFKDSKVRDENGNLKVMYHGTPNGWFTVFKAGTYFTDNKEYADRYQNPGASSISSGKTASNPKTYEVYLDIKKPFDLRDAEARRIYIEDYIKGGNAMGIDPYLSDAEYAKIQTIDWTEGEDLREFLIDNGYDYDGLVLDEGADGGYGDEVKSRGTSYVVFSPEQVKDVDNKTPSFDPDIYNSLSARGDQFVKSSNDIYGKDFRVQNRTDDIAPVAEESAVTEESSVAPVVSEVETTAEELFPDDLSPIQTELDSLLREKEALGSRMLDVLQQEDLDTFYQINTEYEAVTERIKELEAESAEADSDRLNSLEDADAPPEVVREYDQQADVIPLTKKLAADIARDVRSKLGLSNKHMADVHKIIAEYSKGEFPNREQLFRSLKEKFSTYSESYSDELVQEAKSYLRTYGIKVSDSIKKDIADYADLMRRNRGRILFSNKGTDVDVLYHEMNTYYPHLFPEDILNPTDQFLQIVDVANMDSVTNIEQEYGDEFIMEVADSIMQSVADYRQIQREKTANRYGRESFSDLMKSPDQYVPPVKIRHMPPTRTALNAQPDDIAPVFDTSSGQQAFMPEAEAQKTVTRGELHENIVDNIKSTFYENGYDLDEVLKNAKDLSTFATVDNTPQRVMEKALGYKQGQVLADLTVNKVAQNETEGIKWLNSFTDRKNGLLAQISKRYNIKPGSKASAAAQMYAEGFYVGENGEIISYGDAELAKDFPDANVQRNIKGLARDPRIRQIYDETLAAINESRARNAYPEIPRLDNYFLHFRAMDDTFSRLGLPFNPNDIRAKDLPTDLNGVTADLKPGQPYFASAMHRKGKRTSFDLLGGLEKYLTSAKNQIYHIDDIQNLRALRNYIADNYGQANGLDGLDALSEEEAQEKIEKVYNSHLSTFAKFLNEEANVLAGKTTLIDRGLEGVIGRRGATFLDTVNRQVGANMVGYNVSSSLTNFLAPVQGFAKSNKADFIKGFAQFSANKVKGIFGKNDGFADNSPVMIRRKGAERFHRTAWQKVSDPGYALMGAVDSISTELLARAKYNEFTRKGMDSQQAHIETDKWVSRLMGDRSLGQQPQLYNSKTLGLFTKFQLEVRNQLDSQFYDTIQEAKVSSEDIENGLARNAKKAAKITSAFFQLAVGQHLFGKAFESIAGYNPAFDIISVLLTAFGFDDDEDSEDTALDNIEQAFLELLGDLPYTSTFTGGRIPISSALPITEFFTGEDQYGNKVDENPILARVKTVAGALPYHLMPGGYGQAKKTIQGLGMFSDEHPIAGSYTDNGDLRFPVEDTLGNRIQAGLFGQWASGNASDYFDNERKPLNEKQIQEFMDVGLSIQDYWDYRDGLSGLNTLAEKADYINSLNLTTEQKNVLINNLADREEDIDMSDYGSYGSFEEFDFATKNPEKYSFFEENGISYSDYASADEDGKRAYTWAYENPGKYKMSQVITSDFMEYYSYKSDLSDIKADKDENGKTISGSAKDKKIEYINGLDLEYGQKIILFKSLYEADDTYNYEIVEYLNGRSDISYEEEIEILRELGFTVSSDGSVTW